MMRLLLLITLLITNVNFLSAQPCEVSQLSVTTGDCHGDETYTVTLNFEVANATNALYDVWTNNVLYGTFPIASLPLVIEHFPYNGGANDVIKVCVNDNPNCCRIKEFPVPDCVTTPQPCEVSQLSVTTGDCHGDSTYSVTLNFEVANATNALYDVWTNNVLYGTFPIASLPLVIEHFPYNGGANDVIKVCVNDNPNCCRIKEFAVPDCVTTPQPCEVSQLSVTTGDCHGDSTYSVTLNFEVANATNALYDVWTNNVLYGTFPIASLPLVIEHFPYNGGANDVIKVCVNDNPNCCRIKEFPVPDCVTTPQPCEVSQLSVTTGDCHGDSTYSVTLNFEVANATNALYDVWTNNVHYGTFPIASLPLVIEHFPYNGGANDVIKVCVNDNPNCCRIKEFPVPDCVTTPQPCEVSQLSVTTGDCHGDSTYSVTLNFEVASATNALYDVWTNNVHYGTFPIASLPLVIEHFPYNGGTNDVIKVCVNDNPNCCRIKEFPVPDCVTTPQPCEVSQLSVTTGDCHGDSTYSVTLNFEVANATNALYDVWTNNVLYGTFPIASLPLVIEHFPYNGGTNDVIKVCVNDNPNCCRIKEFPVPDCVTTPQPCEVSQLSVTTGDCHGDSTYSVTLNFEVASATNALYDVWTNNVHYGTFPIASLPLVIEHFPYNGGANDVIKVCVNDNPNCCRIKEFPVPDCFTEPNLCALAGLKVQATPCVCGQFFAVITFEHNEFVSNLFDVWVNGEHKGAFPYAPNQPVIAGPLFGEPGNWYDITLKDHEFNNCQAVYELEQVVCPTVFTNETAAPGTTLMVSPNPAKDKVTVLLPAHINGSADGAYMEVLDNTGRLIQHITVPQASASIELQITDWPAGAYRVALQTSTGRYYGSFIH